MTDQRAFLRETLRAELTFVSVGTIGFVSNQRTAVQSQDIVSHVTKPTQHSGTYWALTWRRRDERCANDLGH